MAPAPLRLALDVTSLLDRPTGIGAMTAALVEGLRSHPEVEVVGFAVSWRGRDLVPERLGPGVRVTRRPMAARPLREVWARLDHPVIERWTGPVEVVHGPNFVVPPARRAAELVTVHDLTAWERPELVAESSRAYPRLVARAVARGAHVHTPSEHVADGVRVTIDVDPARVVVVPNGAPDLVAAGPGSDAAAGRTLARSERYVLAVGTIEPRKDLPSLVRAFDLLAAEDPDLHLVVAGAPGWGEDAFAAAVDAAAHGDRVRRTGWVDDAARAALLRGASVVAYPSLEEGFGLVPLEAMRAEVPVVTTRVGAIPEVVGDAAELVAPSAPDELAGALARVLTDEARRAELVAAGRARVDGRGWDASVAAMVELYQRLAA